MDFRDGTLARQWSTKSAILAIHKKNRGEIHVYVVELLPRHLIVSRLSTIEQDTIADFWEKLKTYDGKMHVHAIFWSRTYM